jgi:D-cysteine desulfhydrase
LGYVNAAFELKAQIEEGLMPEPQHIFLAAGTGGTAAGLLLGCHLAGIRARIVAVRVVDSLVCNRRRILQQCKEAWQLLKKAGVPASAGTLDSNRLHLEDAHLGDGFGHPTVASTKAVALVAALEGLPLETVYTGKAFSAMLATLIDSAAARQETSLFWNTCSAAPMEALTRQNANAPARSIRPPGYDEALNVERDSR